MDTVNKGPGNAVLVNEEYYQQWLCEKAKYLISSTWSIVITSFYRDMKEQVSEGDWDELKKFLRKKKKECLEEFKIKGVYFIWKKCFLAGEKDFDRALFFKRLLLSSGNEIEKQDLEDVFSYECLNENIDLLLKYVLELDLQNHGKNVINVFSKNVLFNNGEININKNDDTEINSDNTEDEEILKNIIFSVKLFDSNKRLCQLRDEIGRSIDMGEYNEVLGEVDRAKINPAMQYEWYYIMKAIEESGVAVKRFKCADFIDQMIAWYPWTFDDFNDLQEKKAFVNKMQKSISHEKTLWRRDKGEDPALIKDMWAKYKKLGIDYSKVERCQPVALSLWKGLLSLKAKYEKESNQ